ncbi:MAG: leucine-rich repeat domain-containing protein [Chloroflexota bacterium]
MDGSFRVIRITILMVIVIVCNRTPPMPITAAISTRGQNQPTQIAFDCITVSQVPQGECEALVAIYHDTEGHNWHKDTGWLQTAQPCNWYAVICRNKHVTHLELSNNNLTEELPAEIGNLFNLERLTLDQNNLRSIPAEIGNLLNLERLDLRVNALSSIPPEIGSLSNLERLDLSSNKLTYIPPEIGNLSSLQSLSLSSNELSNIPPEIGNLSKLEAFRLTRNKVRNIPPEIGNLSNLRWVSLSANELSSIPPEIGNLDLIDLFLNANKLSSVPPEIGNLSNLVSLELANNQLTSIPPVIGSLPKLRDLHLNANKLSSIPSEISNLSTNEECSLALPYPFYCLSINLAYNRLVIHDETLTTMLAEYGGGWAKTQAIAPTNVIATALSSNTVQLNWTPIRFKEKDGHYEINLVNNGIYSVHGKTVTKSDYIYMVSGLMADTDYTFQIRTYTAPHFGVFSFSTEDDQQNELWSEYSEEAIVRTLPLTYTQTFLPYIQTP